MAPGTSKGRSAARGNRQKGSPDKPLAKSTIGKLRNRYR